MAAVVDVSLTFFLSPGPETVLRLMRSTTQRALRVLLSQQDVYSSEGRIT